MSLDESKRAYRREMLLASVLVAAGLAISGVSLVRIAAGNAHLAQATQPSPSSPVPAPQNIEPEPTGPAGATPTLPLAPADKMAPPIPQK